MLALLLSAGCTATKATIQIVSAEQALQRAGEHACEKLAAYEYLMAERYLEKAREEVGYSEFRIADALARQSAEWSDRAIISVERRGQELDLDDLEDQPIPTPEPEPEPSSPILERDEE